MMTCTACNRDDYEARQVTRTSDRDGAIVIVRDVPAWVCPTCGDQIYDEGVADRLLDQIKASRQEGITTVVRDFVPAPIVEGKDQAVAVVKEAAIAGGA